MRLRVVSSKKEPIWAHSKLTQPPSPPVPSRLMPKGPTKKTQVSNSFYSNYCYDFISKLAKIHRTKVFKIKNGLLLYSITYAFTWTDDWDPIQASPLSLSEYWLQGRGARWGILGWGCISVNSSRLSLFIARSLGIIRRPNDLVPQKLDLAAD